MNIEGVVINTTVIRGNSSVSWRINTFSNDHMESLWWMLDANINSFIFNNY